jgi:hypothetical protein
MGTSFSPAYRRGAKAFGSVCMVSVLLGLLPSVTVHSQQPNAAA